MATRWHPDTCEGYAEGRGCIIDVTDWGPPIVGTHVRKCARHATMTAASSENFLLSQAYGIAMTLPSLTSRLVRAEDGTDYLPKTELVVTYPNGTPTVTPVNATPADKVIFATALASTRGTS